MGWKDKFTKSPKAVPAPSARASIRALSASQEEAPKTKWDELSDEVLETYVAAEEALRPHAEAGLLAPDMILPNGNHVGGVPFHPYDGAEKAWRERILSRRLLTGRIGDDGSYRFNPADIQRIGDYVIGHIDSLLRDEINNDIKTMEEKKSHNKDFTKQDLKNAKEAIAMLAVPEHVAQLKEIAAKALTKDIQHYRRISDVGFIRDLDGMEDILLGFAIHLGAELSDHWYATHEQQGHVYNYILGSADRVAPDFMNRVLNPVRQQIEQEFSVLAAPKTRE